MSATRTMVPSSFSLRLFTVKRAAQRHEFRIFLDVRDQVEHVGRGVADTALR